MSLLLRFWDPQMGAIRLGGVDLRDFPLDDLWRRISIVQQGNYLFDTSIRENIRIGKSDATDDEIAAAARAANIHAFIVGLPDGYDTVVGAADVGPRPRQLFRWYRTAPTRPDGA